MTLELQLILYFLVGKKKIHCDNRFSNKMHIWHWFKEIMTNTCKALFQIFHRPITLYSHYNPDYHHSCYFYCQLLLVIFWGPVSVPSALQTVRQVIYIFYFQISRLTGWSNLPNSQLVEQKSWDSNPGNLVQKAL